MTSYKFDGHDDHVSDVYDDIEYTEGIVDDDIGRQQRWWWRFFNIPIIKSNSCFPGAHCQSTLGPWDGRQYDKDDEDRDHLGDDDELLDYDDDDNLDKDDDH